MEKENANRIRLISQALNSAISSINLAKKLLGEMTSSTPNSDNTTEKGIKNPSQSMAGIVGVFDGQYLTSGGEKYQVPENYASKSMIVYGDKLKMVEVNGGKIFKQIERVKRQRSVGMIVKKEGRFHVVTSDGSYKVLSAAVSYFNGKEGDEAHILIPLSNRHSPFAAIEKIEEANTKSLAETVSTGGNKSDNDDNKKELKNIKPEPSTAIVDKKPTKLSKDRSKLPKKLKESNTKAEPTRSDNIKEENEVLIGEDELR